MQPSVNGRKDCTQNAGLRGCDAVLLQTAVPLNMRAIDLSKRREPLTQLTFQKRFSSISSTALLSSFLLAT
jgi:hypothetical protein